VITGLLEGYDLLIVLGIIALLFGGSQLPKLARALGSASHEFKRGAQEGGAGEDASKAAGAVGDTTKAPGAAGDTSKAADSREASPT
jgi:sec-independent protein translocase protein TatA